jgi:hypothetical protein
MNDDEMLATMRSSLTGVTDSMTDVHLGRPVSTIQGRARNRRLRRGLAGATTGGLALGIGLALAAGGSSPTSTRSVHVNLDAWSVNTVSGGLVYVDVRQLQDPGLLRQTLAAAGVPAIVTFGEFCTGPSGGTNVDLHQILGKAAVGGEPKLTINPAGIPNGSKLSIGIMTVWKGSHRGLDAAFGLVQNGAQLTCRQPSPNPGPSGKTGPASPAGGGTTKSAGNGTAKAGFGS